MYLSVQLPSAHICADTRSAAPVGTTVKVTYASTATKFELLAVVLLVMLMIAVVLKIPLHSPLHSILRHVVEAKQV